MSRIGAVTKAATKIFSFRNLISASEEKADASHPVGKVSRRQTRFENFVRAHPNVAFYGVFAAEGVALGALSGILDGGSRDVPGAMELGVAVGVASAAVFIGINNLGDLMSKIAAG